MQISLESYLQFSKQLSGGKSVAGSRYFHIEHSAAKLFLNWLKHQTKETEFTLRDFNVLRLGLAPSRTDFSFSLYARFFEDDFPELVWSQKYSLDLVPGRKLLEGQNPAILHRKSPRCQSLRFAWSDQTPLNTQRILPLLVGLYEFVKGSWRRGCPPNPCFWAFQHIPTHPMKIPEIMV
jgi:hypothetical protein